MDTCPWSLRPLWTLPQHMRTSFAISCMNVHILLMGQVRAAAWSYVWPLCMPWCWRKGTLLSQRGLLQTVWNFLREDQNFTYKKRLVFLSVNCGAAIFLQMRMPDDVDSCLHACIGALKAVDARPDPAWCTDDHVPDELLSSTSWCMHACMLSKHIYYWCEVWCLQILRRGMMKTSLDGPGTLLYTSCMMIA